MADVSETPSTPTPAPAAPPAPAKTVAHDVFQRVVEAKTGLEAQVRTLQGEVQALSEKAATVDTLSGEVNRWRSEAEASKGKFQTFTELSGALGINDVDVINTFDSKWSALPVKDRPARAAWVETLKADAANAPTVLRPWLTPSTTTASAPAPADPTRPPQPRPIGAPPTPPGAPSAVSDVEVRRLRETAIKTGNWQPWKDYKKANGLP